MSPWNEWPPYGLTVADKQQRLVQALSELTQPHIDHCPPYAGIVSAMGGKARRYQALGELPFIPVRLFKHMELRSVEPEQVFKTLTSSGTTGQAVSKVYLDRDTAMAQTRALVLILQNFIGPARLPMLVIDHPSVIKSRQSFSARGAGILGLSNFGRDHTYALKDDDMSPDFDAIEAFCQRHAGKPVLLFGFTFMVWKHFVQALQQQGRTIDLSNGVLLHSGGWKKLQDEAVDNATFKAVLRQVTGLQRIHNFYGMAEQVGSVFVECEHGALHAPAFADVLVRRAQDWTLADVGEQGLIQVLSVLPRSYPGHSLLTEDIGAVLCEDSCPCGRAGKTFRVDGRVKSAEVRGCSDTQPTPKIAAGTAARTP
jgi:Acyl-protein synthetase, LuxE